MSIKHSEAFSMGKDKRGNCITLLILLEAQFIQSKDLILTPGPGQYSPSVKQTKGTISPQWSQQKQSKDQVFAKNTPGPGQYVVPSKI